MPTAVKILSNDGKSNLSAESWTAFREGVLLTAAGRDAAVDAAEAEPDVASENLSATQVQRMLGDASEWRLAVRTGDTAEVLERAVLDETWNTAQSETPQVILRELTDTECLLRKEIHGRVAGALERISEAKALPVASAGLVTTIAGAFGFVALDDEVARPGLMLGAVGAGLAAIIVSLCLRYWLTPMQLVPTRLDLLEARHDSLVRRGARTSRAAVALFLLALVLASIAVVPAESRPEATAAIGTPTTTRTQSGLKAEFTVSWTDLGDSVTEVRTTVTSAGRELTSQTTVKSGDAADQSIALELQGPTTVEVRTAAFDATESQVGAGSTRTFALR